MVLQLGDDDLVAGADREPRRLARRSGGVAERVRDEVDPLGGVLGEDDLAGIGADERGDPRSRRLVGVGGLLGELVRAAVHGRVVLFEERPLGVEHLPGTLRRGPGVQVDQRLARPARCAPGSGSPPGSSPCRSSW